MAAGSLDSHQMTQHGKAREKRWTWTDTDTGGRRRGQATDIPDRVPQGGGQRRVQLKGVRGGQGHGRSCGFTSGGGT